LFTLVVSNTNDTPTLEAPLDDQEATVGETFSLSLDDGMFDDVDLDDSLTLSAVLSDGSDLPDWLSFDEGTGEFIGDPALSDVADIRIRITAEDESGKSVSDIFKLSVIDENDAPTIGTGIDAQTALEDAQFSFTFGADAFSDTDVSAGKDSLTYTVDDLSSADGTLPDWLSFDAASRTFSGSPDNADVGDISLKVTATDERGESIAEVFTLTVENVNDAPTLQESLDDQVAGVGEDFEFEFSSDLFTDEDSNDTLTLSATLADGSDLPSWLEFDADTRAFRGSPDSGDVDTLYVRVTATDASGDTASDVFELSVIETNTKPSVNNAVQDQTASEDSLFTFSLSDDLFSDPDLDSGDVLSWSAKNLTGSNSDLPDWLDFDATSQTFSGTPDNGDVGTLAIKITVTDQQGKTASQVFTLTIDNVNDAPVKGTDIEDYQLEQGDSLSFKVSSAAFVDSDIGDTLTYSAALVNGDDLPDWLSFDPSTRRFSGDTESADEYQIRVTATDNDGLSASQVFEISVSAVNHKPFVDAGIQDQSVSEGDLLLFSLNSDAFDDADLDNGDALSYDLVEIQSGDLPDWLSFDSNAQTLTGRPDNDQVGEWTLKVTATDNDGKSASTVFTLTVDNVNDAPELIGTIEDQTAIEAEGFSLKLDTDLFTDADADASLTYEALLVDGSDLPDWLVFDTGSLSFSGTPAAADIGTLDITVTATDESGESASALWSLDVAAFNTAPIFSGEMPDGSATEDTLFTLTLPTDLFSDADEDNLTLTATDLDLGSGLPDWLSFDSASQTFSGTPDNDAVGAYAIRITATDPYGESVSEVLDLSVENVNDAPEKIGTMDDAEVFVDQSMELSLPSDLFTDDDVDDQLSYSATLTSGAALPDWLSFDDDSQTFSGTPTEDGVLEIKVTVTDETGSTASENFDLTVTAVNNAPEVGSGISAQSVNEGETLEFTIPSGAFSDADENDVLTYDIARLGSAEGLPEWLSFDGETGTFSGDPVNADVGDITLKVTATDGDGESASTVFTLTVVNVNDAPTVNSEVTLDDQSADINEGYELTLSDDLFSDDDLIHGDNLTLSVRSESSDTLPDWLSFDAVANTLYGLPAAADEGSYDLRVTATDDDGESVQRSFTLDVVDPDQGPEVGSTLSAITVDENVSLDYSIPDAAFVSGDDQALSYAVENLSATDGALPEWLSFDTTSGVFSGTPGDDDIGDIALKISAVGSGGLSVSQIVTLTVDNINDAPVLNTDVSIDNTSLDIGGSLDIILPDALFSDADLNYGDSLTLSAGLDDNASLPDWISFDDQEGSLSGTAAAADAGTYTIIITATDEQGEWAQTAFQLTVAESNVAPVVNQGLEDWTVLEDESDTFTIPTTAFSDENSDTLTYTVTNLDDADGVLPDWLVFDDVDGVLTANPDNNAVGSVPLKVSAADPAGLTASTVFTVTVENVNDAPVVNADAVLDGIQVDIGKSQRITLSDDLFTDEDSIHGDSLTITAALLDGTTTTDLPGWINYQQAAGAFIVKAADGTEGDYTIEITAEDESGATAVTYLDLSVTLENNSPSVDLGIDDQTAYENTQFDFTIATDAFYDADLDSGDVLSYTVDNLSDADGALPEWLSFEQSTGIFSGLPASTDVGDLTIKVTATDQGGEQASTVFTLSVEDINEAPTAITVDQMSVDENSADSDAVNLGALSATDPDSGDSHGFSITGGADSALFSINSADELMINAGTGLDYESTDSLSVDITATDAQGLTYTQALSIALVDVNEVPVGADSDIITIDEDSSYTLSATDFAFSDPDGDELSAIRITEISEDVNLWLNGSEVVRYENIDAADISLLSVTPDADFNGDTSFRFKVSDGESFSDSDYGLSLSVSAVNDAPEIDATLLVDYTILAGSGESFTLDSTAFSDIDGESLTDGLTVSVTVDGSAAMPDWLSFDASTLTFTNTATNDEVADYVITVTVTDADDLSASQDISLTVNGEGVFEDAAVSNITFSTATFSGTTDSEGNFQYAPGETVTFSIGDIVIGTATGAGVVTPLDMVDGADSVENDQVTNIIRFLQTLDSDGDASNGITLTDEVIAAASGVTIDFTQSAEDFASDTTLTAFLSDALDTETPELVDATEAQLHFQSTLNDNSDLALNSAIGDVIATEDDSLYYTVSSDTFSTSEADGYTLSVTDNPFSSWLSFDATQNVFSGTPDNDQVGSATLTIEATDASGAIVSHEFTVTVENTNDAPVMDSTTWSLTSTDEDNFSYYDDLSSYIADAGATDVDADASTGLAVIAVDDGSDSGGFWQYSLDSGSSWAEISGVAADNALLLDGTSMVRYLPDGENGDFASLTYLAWDQTSGSVGDFVDATTVGGTSAFSENSQTAQLEIASVNDQPVADGYSVTLTGISEDDVDGAGYSVSELLPSFSDVDSSDIDHGIAVTYTGDTDPGYWEYSVDDGVNWSYLEAYDTTSALLLASTDLIRFQPDEENGGTAFLEYRIWDQSSESSNSWVDVSTLDSTSAFSDDTVTATLDVSDVNDAPTLSAYDWSWTSITEDDVDLYGNMVSEILGSDAWDVDYDTVGMAITAVDDGSGSAGVWQYSTDYGVTWSDVGSVSEDNALVLDDQSYLRYQPDGDNGDSASFTYRAWDQTDGVAGDYLDASTVGDSSAFSTDTQTVSLEIASVNDQPVADGYSVTLTGISEDDVDGAG
ncbi:MAG: putative Ig domain-containing protein, partial [Magnetococcales bacterium]|nr:putative Ig domain-containing protein [Magnetococcales bacterium]